VVWGSKGLEASQGNTSEKHYAKGTGWACFNNDGMGAVSAVCTPIHLCYSRRGASGASSHRSALQQSVLQPYSPEAKRPPYSLRLGQAMVRQLPCILPHLQDSGVEVCKGAELMHHAVIDLPALFMIGPLERPQWASLSCWTL
jgi:hypothetical protein